MSRHDGTTFRASCDALLQSSIGRNVLIVSDHIEIHKRMIIDMCSHSINGYRVNHPDHQLIMPSGGRIIFVSAKMFQQRYEDGKFHGSKWYLIVDISDHKAYNIPANTWVWFVTRGYDK